MTLIHDTDLLLIEPTLFTDAAEVGILVESGTDGNITGSVFVSSSAEFNSAGILTNHVMVVAGEPLEITGVLGQTTLSVTMRRDPGAAIVKPGDGSGLTYEVRTFAPLLDSAERWLSRMLGLDANHPTKPLTSENVLNYEDFASLVTLHTIAAAFAQVSAADPADESLQQRAELYARLDFEMRHHLVASIDSTGDGTIDERRSLASGTWVRL